MALKVRKNDTVVIRSGKDRGKKGKVLEILPADGMLVVEGVNKVYRHVKAPRQGEKGQRIEVNGPVYIDNVMVICKSCNKPSRIGYKMEGTGSKAKKVRFCKKCNKSFSVSAPTAKKATSKKS